MRFGATAESLYVPLQHRRIRRRHGADEPAVGIEQREPEPSSCKSRREIATLIGASLFEQRGGDGALRVNVVGQTKVSAGGPEQCERGDEDGKDPPKADEDLKCDSTHVTYRPDGSV